MPDADRPLRPIVRRMAAQARAGRMDRREFFTLASTFGASAAAAYGLLGQVPPARASETPKRGGTLRLSSQVLAVTDPRKFSNTEQGNIARTFCESLLRWEEDATLAPLLLRDWEMSDDARTCMLHLREGVTWTNGDAFTVEDVVHNLTRWCDTKAEGNSMASRMGALIDPDTGKLAAGAVEQVDEMTIRLNLLKPDITLLAGMVDYPALVVHRSFGESDSLMETPLGTGPFELVSLEIGNRAVVKRRENGAWWGGETPLDAVHFIDFGADPSAVAAAFDDGEVDANDETPADFVDAFDALGLTRQVRSTANTLVARMRVDTAPFDDVRLRRAIQMAVNNEITLLLGINGDGTVAENHHMSPDHPEYAQMPPPEYDPVKAYQMAVDAGHGDTEIELISIDGDWRTLSTDAIGAQLRQAGFNLKRTIIAGQSFWNAWAEYPFSTTSWGGRPLGIQVYVLAYKTGQPWNETGFSDPEFDTLLEEAVSIIDPEERRIRCARLQQILRDAGIIIQPYWRNQVMHHAPQVKNLSRHIYRELTLEHVWIDA